MQRALKINLLNHKISALILTIFSFSNSWAQGPTLDWANGVLGGANTTDKAYATVIDQSGNVYVTGSFSGTTDFDPGTGVFNLTAATNPNGSYEDVFIAKYSINGALLWAKRIGASGADFGTDIVLDGSGNPIICGRYNHTISVFVDFDPGSGTFLLNGGNSSGLSAFVLKLSSAGNFIWASSTSAGVYPYSMIRNTDESIVLTGGFAANVDFDPGPGTFLLSTPISTTNAYGENSFVWKLSSNGNFLFAKKFGNIAYSLGGCGAPDYPCAEAGRSICSDQMNDLYITGLFTGNADFDPGTSNFTLTTSGTDAYLLKLSVNGDFIWAQKFGANTTTTERGTSVAVDINNNVLVSGLYSSTTDFDNSAANVNLTSTGGSDVFLIKLSPSGNLVWAKSIGGGPINSLDDFQSKIFMAENGTSFILSGNFQGTMDFDPNAGVYNRTSAGSTDCFFAKYNTDGSLSWAQSFGGAGLDELCKLTLRNGKIAICGKYSGPADMDPNASVFNLTSVTIPEIFLSFFDECLPTTNSLTVSSCGSYTLNGQTYIQTGAYTQNLSTTSGCDSVLTLNLTVNPLPTINAGVDQNVCAGNQVTLSATGATSYSWTGGITDGVPFVPTSSGSYSVTGTNSATSCFSTDVVTVTVNSLPNVDAGADQNVCAGNQVTLSATGATSYSWTGGITDGVPFVPTSSGSYSVTGTNSATSCFSTDAVTVTVNSLPNVEAGADQNVCAGAQVTLTASGATSYSWTGGITNGVPFIPTVSGNYLVTGTNAATSCINTDDVLITVVDNSSSEITENAVSSYTLNGSTYTESGTYIQTIPNSVGCDSTITLNLTITTNNVFENNLGHYHIYPNPTKDIIHIVSPNSDGALFELVDYQGRILLSGALHSTYTELSVENFSNGSYILYIGNSGAPRRIMKIN